METLRSSNVLPAQLAIDPSCLCNDLCSGLLMDREVEECPSSSRRLMRIGMLASGLVPAEKYKVQTAMRRLKLMLPRLFSCELAGRAASLSGLPTSTKLVGKHGIFALENLYSLLMQ